MLYIGETSRKLADRFGEHPRSVEGYNHNSRYHGGALQSGRPQQHPGYESVGGQAGEWWYCTQTKRRKKGGLQT